MMMVNSFWSVPSISYSFVASSSSIMATCALPTGSQAGDIAVLVGVGYKNSSLTIPGDAYPAGWTKVATFTGTTTAGSNAAGRISVSAKILDASDIAAGSITSSFSGVTGMAYSMVAFRPTRPVTTLAWSPWLGTLDAADPAPQAVNVAGPLPTIVLGYVWDGNTGTAAITSAPAFDGVTGDSTSRRIGYKINNGSPADHTIDCGDMGNFNGLASGWIRAA
jgi:hypothetical protein